MIPIDKLEEASSPLITQWELLVLLDCLHGSLRLTDDGQLWKWNTEQRKDVLEAIYQRMHKTAIDTPITKP
jgi:hypothetical protein